MTIERKYKCNLCERVLTFGTNQALCFTWGGKANGQMGWIPASWHEGQYHLCRACVSDIELLNHLRSEPTPTPSVTIFEASRHDIPTEA